MPSEFLQGKTTNPLLHVQRVADILECSKKHVYNLIHGGMLPAVNIGQDTNLYRVKKTDLDHFLKRHELDGEIHKKD